MKKAQEMYDVVYIAELPRFLQTVQKYLDDGWACQGGVSTCYDMQQHHVVFTQAFIKKVSKRSNSNEN